MKKTYESMELVFVETDMTDVIRTSGVRMDIDTFDYDIFKLS